MTANQPVPRRGSFGGQKSPRWKRGRGGREASTCLSPWWESWGGEVSQGDVALACRAPGSGFIETTGAKPTGPLVSAFSVIPSRILYPAISPQCPPLTGSSYLLNSWSLPLPHSLKTLAPGAVAFTPWPWPQFLPTCSWMASLTTQMTHPVPCLSVSWPYILQWLSPLLSPITTWLCHCPKFLHLLNHKLKHPKSLTQPPLLPAWLSFDPFDPFQEIIKTLSVKEIKPSPKFLWVCEFSFVHILAQKARPNHSCNCVKRRFRVVVKIRDWFQTI